MRVLIASTLLVVLLISLARGDMPLPPPSKVTFTSSNRRVRAVSDPKSGTSIEDVKQQKILWRLPDWHRKLYVADDGKHVVSEYDGLELIPTDFTDDLVLFTFWSEGKKIRDVTLREFVPDRKILQETASHYYWGRIEGFDPHGRLKAERADGKKFLFDIATGKAATTSE
jgi:hypothetical protein